MHSRWTVLGGWGVEPRVLRPLFGEASTYIDVNRLTPGLIDAGGNPRPDWREQCAVAIAPGLKQPRLLAGWSTGAIIALGCAALLQPDALVLISATVSFCRTTEFRHGMRPAALRSMREKLSIDPSAVLRDFRRNCGLEEACSPSVQWTVDELSAGLLFLEQTTLIGLTPPHCPVLFIHGIYDSIIPFAAGVWLQRRLGGKLLSLDAPHACFVHCETAIRADIASSLKGFSDESV